LSLCTPISSQDRAGTTDTAHCTFVLVHGAWQGAWAWDTIVPRLTAAGHAAIAVDLPGNGFDVTPPQDVTLDLYAAHVAQIVDGVAGPVVLVGHSMGGTAVAQTCELRCDRIALAVYLCAFLLPDGMSVLDFYGAYLKPEMRGAHARVRYDAEGLRSSIDPQSAVEVFYHRADPVRAAAAARRLTPQPEGGRRSPLRLSPERFGTVPRVYIEALDDRSVHLPLQRTMQQLTPCLATYRLDSDHAPQLSQPDALTALLLQAVAQHARPA
jgi:pimeloyl-ACP methyl ester carboxylesterase